MRFPAALLWFLVLGSVVFLASPGASYAQAARAKRADTLTAAERTALREATRDANAIARKSVAGDSVTRRARADSAKSTAFADPLARTILERARVARVTQDSALTAYKATTTQRISIGIGARRLGLEKLLFRSDNVANIAWRRDVGVRVTPVGSRLTVPMASRSSGDLSAAVSIPYFPGRETLWFPSSNFGVVKTDIDEREMIHPIANGAEAYYRYATGDSVNITLPEGRVIRLRELRITARRPEWRLFVGSFWFDQSGGQLVRAAYRLAVDIELWDLAEESDGVDRLQRLEADRVRDSIARARLPRELYVKDSTSRAPKVKARADGTEDDDVPILVKAILRPARAKLDAITVEYGLYQGKFWLPRANSATASMQMGFVRTPFSIDEKFTYEEVNGDFSLAPIPLARFSAAGADSAAADSTFISGSTVSVTVGSGSGRRDTTAIDTLRLSESERTRRRLCQTDSVYTRVDSRYDGALRIAYDLPCDSRKLANSPALPPATADDEALFDLRARDELLGTLDLSLQPAWAPQRPTVRLGSDLVRYNRVEGLSVGVLATQLLGAGYTLRGTGRLGHADLHANGELSLARSSGGRTITGAVFHRLAASNPEWAGALSLGPSLPAVLYGRDEGFYYRSLGLEIADRRDARHGQLEYRLFAERQWTAGDTDVVNTFSFANALSDRQFALNITADRATVVGLGGSYSRALIDRPRGLRLTAVTRLEGGTGTFDFGRGSLESTVTRPVGRYVASLTGAAGASVGTLPAQRAWYVGGVRTVRGQLPGTQAGNAFWIARAELGTRQGFLRPVGFFDVGWAGDRTAFSGTQAQRGAGFGFGALDGLLRVDVARGLYPNKRWRLDFYFDAPI